MEVPDNMVQKIKKNFRKFVFGTFSNKGFGAANNFAVRRLIEKGVEFDSICLLNNDTLPKCKLCLYTTSFDSLSLSHPDESHYCTRKRVSMDENKRIIILIFLGLNLFKCFRTESSAAEYLHGTLRPTDDPTLLEVYWINAVCLMMSRSLWEK